jgi:glycine cleavage system aminomethyltransferase T
MIHAEPAPPHVIPGTAEIPFDPRVTTYTRFGSMRFEPFEYTGWVDECMSWKRTCYIGDWSPLSNKFLVKGPDALRFFSDISVNSLAKFEVGQAKHSIQCNSRGKVVCEGVLMRLGADEILFTCGPTLWTEYQFARGGYDASAVQLGFGQFIKQVQGPNSLYLLEKVTGESLRDIGFMRFRKTRIGHREFYILRQGMSGELGYELHGDSRDGAAIHEAILEAGQEFGIRRLGGRTKMINHVEACFPTPTVDYVPAMHGEDDYIAWCSQHAPEFLRTRFLPHTGSLEIEDISALHRSPVELGWGKNIKFDHEFIGRAALEAEVAQPRRNMVTLVWNAEDVKEVYASLFDGSGEPYEPMELPRNYLGCVWADQVLHDGKLIGVSTSRCYSYHSREMISLCTIDVEYREPGTQVTVVWGRPGSRQKHIRATVAPAPYKQDNRRIDVTRLPPRASER